MQDEVSVTSLAGRTGVDKIMVNGLPKEKDTDSNSGCTSSHCVLAAVPCALRHRLLVWPRGLRDVGGAE